MLIYLICLSKSFFNWKEVIWNQKTQYYAKGREPVRRCGPKLEWSIFASSKDPYVPSFRVEQVNVVGSR